MINAKPGLHSKPGSTQHVRPALTRQPTAEERRRAQRVLLRMKVNVYLAGKPEPVVGYTHTVSATGAMIILPEGFPAGTKFTLENPKTQERVEVNVVRPSQLNQDWSLVPVGFLTPAPKFWHVFFPPTLTDASGEDASSRA